MKGKMEAGKERIGEQERPEGKKEAGKKCK
jgi:hypothetical protein